MQAFYDASRGHAELAIETLVPVELRAQLEGAGLGAVRWVETAE